MNVYRIKPMMEVKMADKHTKRGSKPKDTKSLPVVPSKRWFDDWAIITHRTNHGDEVKVISMPNAKAGRYVWSQEVYEHDQVRDIIGLLEGALYELTNDNAPLSNLEGRDGDSK